MLNSRRLIEAMTRKGVSQGALAREVGVTPPAIQQLVNGKTLRTRVLPEIAKALDVSQAWLRNETDDPSRLFEETAPPEEIEALRAKASRDQIITDANATLDEARERSRFYEAIARTWLRSAELHDLDSILGRPVRGNGMAPALMHNDEVIYDTSQNTLDSQGDIWAIVHIGIFSYRRLFRVSETRVRVAADDPAEADFEVDLDQLTILGRALHMSRSL